MPTNQQSNNASLPDKNKRRLYIGAGIIFFLFASLYAFWILYTTRNIVHMDMITIISVNIKHLYEGNLKVTDFFYQPLFPCLISMVFTFLNAKIFHLNTVIETIAGISLLTIAGYKYLKEMGFSGSSKVNSFVFAFVVGFVLFGFHKWEAVFTSFFSFAAFFNLCIFFFSYLFIAKYIDPGYKGKSRNIILLPISNLLVVLEATSYYYSYVLSIMLVLLLVWKLELIHFHKKRLKLVLLTNTAVLAFAILTTLVLAGIPSMQHHAASQVSIGNFITTFLEKPFWIIEFYLLAHTGPFLGVASDNLELRTLIGLLILISYGIAIYYFIKKKDKWMLVPIILILYNLISYSLVTISRYSFNVVEYGSSSRYTAFTLSGVLGLASIMVYYIFNGENKILRYVNLIALISIFICYINMAYIEKGNAPFRTEGLIQIRETLLTGENLESLQSNMQTGLAAIKVLSRYKLNVYHNYVPPIYNLDQRKKMVLTANTPDFLKMIKTGIHETGHDLTWTNGNASIFLDSMIQVSDSLSIQLEAYMPPICKNINPEITITDKKHIEYHPALFKRTGDIFTYNYYFKQPIHIKSIKIVSDTIEVPPPDLRTLSFPLLSLELKK